ncbi:MAG: ABC transporter permease [Trueperaceae bacterium]|nr:MAG: ABC transporter permease [Trueperaceae bacterium]
MWTYIVRRLLIVIPVMLGVAFMVFSAMYLIPGDAVDAMLRDTGASAEAMARLRAQMGLDQPFHVQFLRFLGVLASGDLGRSLVTGRLVSDQIVSQLPATIELTLAALAIAILIGVPLGVVAALRRGSWIDTSSMVVALVGVSMPNFWLGLLFILFFSLQLGWFPASGTGGWRYLVLPAVTLGFSGVAIIARITRSSLLEVIHADYVRTAHSKGLKARTVVLKHAMRNSMASVMTVVGLQFGALLGGSVVVETVFGRQGLGSLTVGAIQRADLPVVQATVMLAALAFVLVNLLVDVSYSLLDPRIRYG